MFSASLQRLTRKKAEKALIFTGCSKASRGAALENWERQLEFQGARVYGRLRVNHLLFALQLRGTGKEKVGFCAQNSDLLHGLLG